MLQDEALLTPDGNGSSEIPPSFPPVAPPKRNMPENLDLEITDINHLADAVVVPAKSFPRRIFSWLLEVGMVIGIAVLISALVKTFLWQPFEIPSESMANTLIPKDRILVNKLADSEEDLIRGDVVVFVDPGGWLSGVDFPEYSGIRKTLQNIGSSVGILPANSGKHLVKRIIGMPGDKVVCCNVNQRLEINGVEIVEDYLHPGVRASEEEFSVVVPPGHVWLMGDNRPNSKDARYHQTVSNFGFVPIENIEGRAFLRLYPFSRFEFLKDYGYVFSKVKPAAK